MRVNVEVCVTSVSEALAAERAGADSVELCTWLAAGGVTPSIGLVRAVAAHGRLPVRVLVRAHGGGFRYTPDDLAVMEADIGQLGTEKKNVGAVIGALGPDGFPDLDFLGTARSRFPRGEFTFHRAIDHAADPVRAAALCQEAGVQRILTSGGRSTAIEGVATLRALVQQAGRAVRIAAAGSIGPGNVVEIVERTGLDEVHFAAQVRSPLPGGAALASGAGALEQVEADVAKIEGVLNALVKAGLR